MTKPPLRLIHGGYDVVEALEDALKKAKAGEFDAIVISGITTDGHSGTHWAHRDDMAHPWSRMVAAVAASQHDLMVDGLKQ